MITTKIKRIKRIHTEIDRVFCDWCGDEIKDETLKEFKGFGTAVFSFGFGSCYDTETFSYHICDRCFEILKRNMEKQREGINKEICKKK